MLTSEQALAQLLAAARPITQTETLPTLEAGGRILARAVSSTIDVPGMDNSAMDGYALRAADLRGEETRLPVSQRIAAGHVGEPLQPGTAARIFTGAPVPPGADAVVMQERCEAVDEGRAVIVRHQPRSGESVRHAGEDIRKGATVLEAGARLDAAQLGLAASVGLPTVEVFRRPRVAVFFTGDELLMPGEPLRPGAIYNTNRFVLTELLRRLGCEVNDLGIVPDSLAATRAALRQAAEGADLILTSGGVSVGEEDHLKPAVDAEGRLDLWQIAIKPGKPLAFGEVNGAERPAAFIGLPGNPVSSLVTFLIFVRPWLLATMGAKDLAPAASVMRADFAWPKPDRRNEFLRVRRNAEGGLDLYANQGSGVLTGTAWADGLVDNPPGQTIAPGDLVRFLPFADLMV
ncbi:MAG: molybdopterin molybdotransferase MoeA [Candidatus Protistobacter heckmanni]|nr:molybdopterin molybdotransferase MoeA [Candidatus Protistobacter heckmanni]